MNLGDVMPGLMTFGRRGFAVTPDDNADLPGGAVKAVVATSAGNLAVIPVDSATPIAFTGVPAGFLPPFIVRRVMATGTTATVAAVAD